MEGEEDDGGDEVVKTDRVDYGDAKEGTSNRDVLGTLVLEVDANGESQVVDAVDTEPVTRLSHQRKARKLSGITGTIRVNFKVVTAELEIKDDIVNVLNTFLEVRNAANNEVICVGTILVMSTRGRGHIGES